MIMIHESDKAQILNAQFDATNIKFRDRSTALQALLAGGCEVIYTEDGSAQVHYDGERLGLRDALTRLAFDQRDLVDGRTLPREGTTGRQGTLSKADMTLQEKIAYVRDHGADAFARIPSVNFDTKPVTTREDFYRLSRAEKVRRIAADPNILAKLPSAPKVSVVEQLETVAPGVRINRAGLEKQKAIRGGR
jgi:hypothetical protein